ncbi:unnamed protein product [Paramecium sonneborni]|uniref:Uncharacterized protein n=1 Tax=Paramecium sonneborni TaxID=65129 RepID=A0A8S1M3Q4_9CILI|nr:unnamed protein product [Paramecium sonneborni]
MDDYARNSNQYAFHQMEILQYLVFTLIQSYYGIIRLQQKAKLDGHSDYVQSVYFLQDGTTLTSDC